MEITPKMLKKLSESELLDLLELLEIMKAPAALIRAVVQAHSKAVDARFT